jgi:hypothetical protein
MIEELKGRIVAAIPWTRHEINMLEQSKNPGATIAQFAKEQGLGGAFPPEAVKMLKSRPDTPEERAKFDEIFGQGAAAKALGK